MEYLKFILYGLIQGLTEFIPISSTAHLKIIPPIFGFEEPGHSMSAIIQLGSVLALFWYFKKDIFNLISHTRKKHSNFFRKRLLNSVLIATIPIVLLGGTIKLFEPYFFEEIFRSNLSIALVSFLMAIFMYTADCSKKAFVNLNNHNYSDSFLIGLSQAFAIFPGVSRSGVTISTALVSGWERADATKFSFLLGIPSISLAAIVELISPLDEYFSFSLFPLIVGLTTTFVTSLLAIHFLIKYISLNGLKLFIIYRIVFGFLIILNL